MSVVVRLPEDRQRPVDTRALAAACAAAARAAARASDARTAVEGTLAVLYDAFEGELLGALFLNDHDRLWLVAQHGHNVVPDGLDLARRIIGRAGRTGEAQYAAKVTDDAGVRTHAGTQFDPEVVARAIELLEDTRTREPALHRPPT